MAGSESDLLAAIGDLERERGIDKETLLLAVEQALVSAYRRNLQTVQQGAGAEANIQARIDRETGVPRLFLLKTVVEAVENPDLEISVEEARRLRPSAVPGDVVEIPIQVANLGRIAAQTAKQVVVQRIREAERGMVYEEFASREGDLITGTVARVQGRNVYVDLGKTEAVMPPAEQIPGEQLRQGQRVKVYIEEVRLTTKGPQVVVSRAHPGLLRRLFELEIPEVHDGVVEIRGIAREAGARSKVAVAARDPNIDPVGACVGPKHMRISNIVAELEGEKVDVIAWAADPATYVANALRPAKATSVQILEGTRTARVIVPDYQLSLAIGKAGQNARLAAKLTGWRIDIRSETQVAEEEARLAGGGEPPAPPPSFAPEPEPAEVAEEARPGA
ncbi:MAG: transcription termination/antitermination protein NusA [Clostridia bacterium]|nr:transcription termination/antitermination protein NusA [Clostridia bacterium]